MTFPTLLVKGLVSIKMSSWDCIGVSGVKIVSQVAFGFQGSNWALEFQLPKLVLEDA